MQFHIYYFLNVRKLGRVIMVTLRVYIIYIIIKSFNKTVILYYIFIVIYTIKGVSAKYTRLNPRLLMELFNLFKIVDGDEREKAGKWIAFHRRSWACYFNPLRQNFDWTQLNTSTYLTAKWSLFHLLSHTWYFKVT